MQLQTRRALWLGALAGLGIALSCGPVKTDGPTAIVVKVLLNEGRGSRILYITGVDDTPVDVFSGQYRPEQPSPMQLPTGQSVRILLDDSLAGTPINITVVGLDVDNVPIEANTARVTPVLRQETMVTVKLTLYTQPDGGMGGGVGGGTGGGGGSTNCQCSTGCCDGTGQCAEVDAGRGSHVVFVGPVGAACQSVCPLLASDHYSADAGCGCGTGPSCGTGLRCEQGRCRCDSTSNCNGCCTSSTTCVPSAQNIGSPTQCGAGGQQCEACSSGVCTVSGTCGSCSTASDKCCSGASTTDTGFPTCRRNDGACQSCDLARTDRCVPPTVANAFESCSCGSNGKCGILQACVAGTCVQLP